ncbi:MAG: RHS repeat domain-containing protein, partial [Roseimicrobium sp.]
VATSYTANALNQYTSVASVPSVVNPTHDPDGNQLSGATGQAAEKTFEWDGENRLIAVKDNGTILVRYAYDHQSPRIRRSEGASTTLYVYDGWNCVAEYQAGSAGILPAKTLTWGLDLSGTLQGAGGVGGLLASTSLTPSPLSHFPVFDGNGNISEYLTATGSIAAHYEYAAFGNVIASTGNAAAFDYRFSTKPQDAVTGWNYYGYRWYDAAGGRWVSRDPLGELGGVNLYNTLHNNLLNATDRLGQSPNAPDCCATERRDFAASGHALRAANSAFKAASEASRAAALEAAKAGVKAAAACLGAAAACADPPTAWLCPVLMAACLAESHDAAIKGRQAEDARREKVRANGVRYRAQQDFDGKYQAYLSCTSNISEDCKKKPKPSCPAKPPGYQPPGGGPPYQD